MTSMDTLNNEVMINDYHLQASDSPPQAPTELPLGFSKGGLLEWLIELPYGISAVLVA